MENVASTLKEDFENAFVFPYATHLWRGDRAANYWSDMEGLQDTIAGPILTIVETGGCEYIYAREGVYSSDIKDPESLRRVLLYVHGKMQDKVMKYRINTLDDLDDQTSMRLFLERIKSIVDVACTIEDTRLR